MDELKSPIRHLNTDTPIRSLSDGDYPFALNTVNESTEGEQMVKSRERSTAYTGPLPEGHMPLGQVYTTDNRIVVFSTDGSESAIGITDGTTYESLIVDEDCLEFSKEAKVSATYRRRLGCQDTVYFTDGVNKPKVINISDLDDYKNEDGEYDCELFDLIREYLMPCIADVRAVEGGGSLRYGTYSVAICYVDEDYNQTEWLWSSKVVYVKNPNTGGINPDVNPILGEEPPGHTLEVNFENLDLDYPYYRVAIIEASSGTGQPDTYIASPAISTNQDTFTYTGNKEGFTALTLEELRIPRADIATAETLGQVENTLVLGNVKGRQYPYCEWQKAASKICTNYVIKEIPESEYYQGSSEFEFTLMGDEVEQYGVMFLIKGGFLSPVYPIPGRAKDVPACFIDDGETGTPDRDQLCLELLVTLPPCDDGYMRYEIEYKVEREDENGNLELIQPLTTLTGSVFDEDSPNIRVFCADIIDPKKPPIFTVTNFEYRSFYREPDCEGEASWSITEKVARRVNLPAAVHGHDSTVYTHWTEDMAHLLTEEQFDNAMNKYANDYFGRDLEDDDRNDAEFQVWLSENASMLPQRWEIYNTAIPYTDTSGSMGYYECKNAVYRNPHKDCVDDYWGVDYVGNKLEGTPIRHHRSPDRIVEPITDGEDDERVVRAIGVRFSNLEYPHPDIIGHYFVKVPKTEQNSTVVDMGISKALHNEDAGLSYNNMWTESSRDDMLNYYFISPKVQYEHAIPSADYVKYLKNWRRQSQVKRPSGNDEFFERQIETGLGYNLEFDLVVYENTYLEDDGLPLGNTNRELVDRIIMEPITRKRNVRGFQDEDTLVNQNMIDFRLFMALSGYVIKTTGTHTLRTATLKRNIQVGCNLDSSKYTPLHDCPFEEGEVKDIYGGDVTMSEFVVTDMELGGFDIDNYIVWQEASQQLVARVTKSVWVESRYDNRLRIQGVDANTTHLAEGDDYREFFFSKVGEVGPGSKKTVGWIYNPDYLRQRIVKEYFPLTSFYDCCSKCLETHPNRFHYSLDSFNEDRSDFYRIFLPNNYIDVDSDTGDIVDMAIFNKEIIYWTEEAQWKLPYGYVERANEDGIITFLGDGGLFSRPPMKLVDSQAGSYGMLFKNSWVKTPHGLVSVDPRSGKVILYNGQLDILSDKKNRNYFKNNLLRGVEDITVGYDERHERLLVTKLGAEGERDLSWTMSYSFLDAGWVGWHSYLPALYMTGKDMLLYVDRDGGIWRQNAGAHYCMFGNKKYPHILEVVFNANGPSTRILNELTLATSALRYSTKSEEYSIVDDVTFDEMIIYTEKQCTGKVALSPIDESEDFFMKTIEQKADVANLKKVERDWRVNDFFDLVVDYDVPFFNRDWESIKDEYFIDKVINDDAVSYGKDWQDLQPLRDKYFVVRLSINSQHMLKLVTYYLAAGVSESIR
jgi:hypothetical protein